MKAIVLEGTCTAGGALTVTSTEGGITGYVEKIVMDYVDGDTGSDLTFTAEEAGVSHALLTVTNAGTADITWYPRTLGNKIADASAFTDIAEKVFVVTAEFKLVVAQGGTSKDFKMIVYVSDE